MTTSSTTPTVTAVASLIRKGDRAEFGRLVRLVFGEALHPEGAAGDRIVRTLRAMRESETLAEAAERLSIRVSGLMDRLDVIEERTALDPRHTRDRFLLDLALFALEVTTATEVDGAQARICPNPG